MSEEDEDDDEELESELELEALRRDTGTCCADDSVFSLAFLGGFLVELSCPLTSCNRFSSSRFFSKASSSFVFPTGFLIAGGEKSGLTLLPSLPRVANFHS